MVLCLGLGPLAACFDDSLVLDLDATTPPTGVASATIGSGRDGSDSGSDPGEPIRCTPGSEQVVDGSFEGSTFAAPDADDRNPDWVEVVPPGRSSPLCNGACTTEPSTQAAEGQWWASFEGAGPAATWRLEQDLFLPLGADELRFAFGIAASSPSGNDSFEARIDEQTVFATTANEIDAYADWTAVTVAIDALADGRMHTLSFVVQTVNTPNAVPSSAFVVDDVSVPCL